MSDPRICDYCEQSIPDVIARFEHEQFCPELGRRRVLIEAMKKSLLQVSRGKGYRSERGENGEIIITPFE